MTKQKLSSILIILTIILWSLSMALIFPEHVKPLMAIAMILPIVPAAIVIWIQSSTLPLEMLDKINKLAIKVERDLEKERVQIESDDIPEGVQPLINAINRLLRYQNDRYQQERDFTAHASHELRTPLAGIRLQTELAMMTDDPEKRNKALGNIMTSIDRSTRLVEQLLTISRLTAENVDLAMDKVDLVVLAQTIISGNNERARQKNIVLNFDCEMPSFIIEASEESLSILLDNMVRNAITYTPEGGAVTIEIEESESANEVLLCVSDTGPGIPAHLRAKVLERFEKADKGSNTGTGLGLAIVSRIASLHRGRLELRDALSGTGLRICAVLPVRHIRLGF